MPNQSDSASRMPRASCFFSCSSVIWLISITFPASVPSCAISALFPIHSDSILSRFPPAAFSFCPVFAARHSTHSVSRLSAVCKPLFDPLVRIIKCITKPKKPETRPGHHGIRRIHMKNKQNKAESDLCQRQPFSQ